MSERLSPYLWETRPIKHFRSTLTLLCATALFVLGLASCTDEPQLAEIPAFDALGFEDSLEVVRTQMLSAYERLQGDPLNHELNGHLGMLLSAYSKNATSEVFYSRAHTLKPAEFRWAYYLAVTAQQLGRYDEAAQFFRDALVIEPGNLEARLQLARVLLQNNEYEQSVDLYRSITTELPDRIDGWLGLGKALDGSGDLQSALTALKRAKNLGPQYGDVRYALAAVLSASGKKEEAAREFSAYEKRARVKVSTSDQYTLSVIRLNASDGPFLSKADYQIARGQFKEAIGFFRRALDINPANQDAWGGLVFAQSKLGDREGTKASYTEALAAGIHYKRLHFTYAQALQKWERLDEAREVMGEAIKLDPRYSEALVAMGELEMKLGASSEAVKHFISAVAVAPNDQKLRLTLAQALIATGKFEQAASQLEPLTKDPSARRALAYRELAVAYKELGRTDEAIVALERGREIAEKAYNATQVETIDALLFKWRGK